MQERFETGDLAYEVWISINNDIGLTIAGEGQLRLQLF